MIPEPVKYVTCERCLQRVNPMLARYLWVGFGWRGQRVSPDQGAPREQRALTLCGPCGKTLLDLFATNGYPARLAREGLASGQYVGPDDYFARGVVRG